MASTDGGVAVAGVFQLLLAYSPFMSAIGGAVKVQRDSLPAGVALPAVAVSKSGFRTGTRPQQQGGRNTQIWSLGTITLSFATAPGYSDDLVRLALDALDNQAEVVVPGKGVLRWIRATDDVDEPVNVGDRQFKLTRVNFQVAAKAT